MSILDIITIPHPLLIASSAPVNQIDNSIHKFIEDLVETLYSFPHCRGISAPQVNIPLRIIAIDASRSSIENSNNGLLVLINPELIFATGQDIEDEECLSIPLHKEKVRRPSKIKIKYISLNEKTHILKTEGIEARIIQHEIDHLEGLLFTDRTALSK